MTEVKISATPLTSEVCRFQFSQNLLGETNSFVCQSSSEAKGSFLLEKLFEVDLVKKVSINGNELKVQTERPVDWKEKAKEVGKTIRECLDSGKNLLSPNLFDKAQEKEVSQNSDEDLEAIKKVLKEQVLPGLASHGGSVEVVDYKEGVLSLSFLGGCQGCSQVNVTVRQGIERLLKAKFPNLKEVKDVTNHSAGTNPYFS